jgi:hypothetical protein
MVKIGDTLKVRGGEDRLGYTIPTAVSWTVVVLEPIEEQRMFAAVARGLAANGRTLWLAGRVDARGRPGHPPSPMQGYDALIWETEGGALENHAERKANDSW